MNEIEKIADAILYEGYNLYPYRKDALKNQKRFNFGIVSSEKETFQHLECLILSENSDAEISFKIRFLQIENSQDWQSVIPRECSNSVNLREILDFTKSFDFNFSADENFLELNGKIEISATKLGKNLYKLKLILQNLTQSENAENNASNFISTHQILNIKNAKFLSLLETPGEFQKFTQTLENKNVFPVLVGDKSRQNSILASPIILYDFPKVSENSFAEMFDGTEIDELLVLSILALTDKEKREIRRTDEKAAKVLDKIENMNKEDLLKLHAEMSRK